MKLLGIVSVARAFLSIFETAPGFQAFFIKLSFALLGVGDALINLMTASIFERATA